ncbi:ecdysteroid 22-kinase family protein [Alteromonas sp. ASW11-19]|uniref:Ecdysteroid 22-kinase family protein n=1 Tax=Alteromonas salexigens TaxID=2982530 RepID=A0ABT2VM81_9ALTE|nr:ecdysteroid 22-kinase family protein [Alteromonas salexigens]MCU7553952.1 ecdysteroid 22-kinase family protein [Alteromonas salexigens]
MNPDWLSWVAETLNDPDIQHISEIQPLWSGYGTCVRFYSPVNRRPLVAKVVMPATTAAHPKGWQSAHSHQRKLHSFAVETAFYTDIQPSLPAACATPPLVAHERRGEHFLLVMEDLAACGYTSVPRTLSVAQCHTVLKWLAEFHAHGLGSSAAKLWKRGTYWHLATREAEWHAMAEGPLKQYAREIADALHQCKWQTLLHGDAKVANFCFTPGMDDCAAIDFQYCGGGVGTQDVAYFLGSALSEADLLEHTDACLEVYFTHLDAAMTPKIPAAERQALYDEWQQAYSMACADFYRFLAGWSPQHKKINRDLKRHTHQALRYLTTQSHS